jgi:hypothetical protein
VVDYLPTLFFEMTPKTTLIKTGLLKSVHGTKLDDGSSFTVVVCDSALSGIVDTLGGLSVTPSSSYVSLEGIKISRQGTFSILQLYVLVKDYTYLVYVHQLRHTAFSITRKHSDKCLKAIL